MLSDGQSLVNYVKRDAFVKKFRSRWLMWRFSVLRWKWFESCHKILYLKGEKRDVTCPFCLMNAVRFSLPWFGNHWRCFNCGEITKHTWTTGLTPDEQEKLIMAFNFKHDRGVIWNTPTFFNTPFNTPELHNEKKVEERNNRIRRSAVFVPGQGVRGNTP